MTSVNIPAPAGLDIVDAGDGRMIISMGPQHPSTHGVLQVMTELEGEIVTRADPEIGYLHTGIEKSAENLFWTQASTVIERMDYLSPLSNARCYIMGVEKLLGITDRHSGARAASARPAVRTAPHRLALRLARHRRHRSRRDLGLFLRVRSARAHSRPDRTLGRRAHAPELPAHRRLARRSARRLLAQSRRVDRDVLPAHARSARALAEESDPSGPHDRRRHPQRRGCARVGRHRPVAARDRRARTTCAARFPYSGYETVRVRRRDAHRRRRLRALHGAARRDGPVDAHRRAGAQATRARRAR